MAKPRTHKQKDEVLAACFVALVSFSENALSPTQKTWAKERAENCLWALSIESHKGYRGEVYHACAPEPFGPTIDLQPLLPPLEAQGGGE